jgi:hypothetical protein
MLFTAMRGDLFFHEKRRAQEQAEKGERVGSSALHRFGE